MTGRHVLVVGSSLAAEFTRAQPSVTTSVVRRRPADAPSSGGFLRAEVVEPGSAPAAWLAAARIVDRTRPVDRVVAFGENEQVIAALIAADLGLDGHHGVEVARAVADKIEMRRRLAVAGLGTVKFAEAADARAIEQFAHGHPESRWLVKPAMGTGSRGVSELVDVRRCQALFDRAREVAHPVAGARRVIVEEFKPGRQLSVESLSENGRHRPVAVTQKYTDERTFAEVGHCVPATLSDSELSAVIGCTTAALDALGVRYGPTHTELVLARSGQVDLIETHTRLGGHGIPHLVAGAVGVDMQALTFAQVAGASVFARLPETAPKATRAQAVWFGYSPAPGRVRAVRSEPRSDAHVEVLVNPGDVVTADMTRASRVLAARASGRDETEAVRRASRAVSAAAVVVECSMTAQLLSF